MGKGQGTLIVTLGTLLFGAVVLVGCSDDTKPAMDSKVIKDIVQDTKTTNTDGTKPADKGTSNATCHVLTGSDVETTCSGSGTYTEKDITAAGDSHAVCTIMFQSTTKPNQTLQIVTYDLIKYPTQKDNVTSCSTYGGTPVGTNACLQSTKELNVVKGNTFYRIANGSTTELACTIEQLKALAGVIDKK
jgi:hypothetical protein